MKKVTADFTIVIRNVETFVKDDASTTEIHDALNKKVTRSLFYGEYWVDYTRSSEKELCPSSNGTSGFELPFGWAEIEFEKIQKDENQNENG